jgi:Cu(I)/Ag(I) efflux system membrane fusion protein
LTIPRSAVISRGIGPMVYVDKGDGHYAPRAVLLGRVGDEFVEVLGGLEAGEKVVTTGNVLIDSEAQLTAGE